VAHNICFGAEEKLKINESLTTKLFCWHICFDVNTVVKREWYQAVFNNTLLITQLRDVFSLLTEKVVHFGECPVSQKKNNRHGR